GAARNQDVRSRAGRDVRVARCEGELAVQDEERLLHVLVDVRHGPGTFAAAKLGEREFSVGCLAGGEDAHLDIAEIDDPPVARSHRVRVSGQQHCSTHPWYGGTLASGPA